MSQALPSTAPKPDECAPCYLHRMLSESGCDSTYRWTIRWIEAHPDETDGNRILGRLMDLLDPISEAVFKEPGCDCMILGSLLAAAERIIGEHGLCVYAKPGESTACDLRRGSSDDR